MVGKQRRNGHFHKPSKPSMRDYSPKNYYGESRALKPLIDTPLMDTPHHATFEDECTLFATFCRGKPAASTDDVYHFFWSNYGDVIHSIRMDEQNPPLHAWVTFHTPEMAKGVLGEGPLPVKMFMLGGKSIWLKPTTIL